MTIIDKDTVGEKKYKEFCWIQPLINLHSSDLIDCRCSEEPDFRFQFEDNIVGVEFSMLTRGAANAEFNEFKKLLSEYAEYFDKVKSTTPSLYKYEDIPYRIKIWFVAGFKPHTLDGGKVKKHKDELFKDLDRQLFPSTEFIDTKYVANIDPVPAGNLTKSEFQICYINQIVQVRPSSLIDIVKKKEAKLKKYKLLERNKSIQEYWLAIGIEEQFDFYSVEIPQDFKTGFSKIYAVNSISAKQLI